MTSAENQEGRLISIRKLVAWDITLHGSRIILIEFAVGAPAMILFGYWLTTTTATFIPGLYILSVGINYVPLLLYAAVITRKGSAKNEVNNELVHNKQYTRKYGSQQLIILTPFAVLLIALAQGTRKQFQKRAQ
jgi:hypothetical protein